MQQSVLYLYYGKKIMMKINTENVCFEYCLSLF